MILDESEDGKYLGNDWFNFGNVVDRTQHKDPMIDGKFIIDGKDRMETRNGKYFRLIQPYQRHTTVPEDTYIYVYSFAIRPEEYQPSGTCNYSRIDNSVLNLTFKNTGCPISYDFFIFAVNNSSGCEKEKSCAHPPKISAENKPKAVKTNNAAVLDAKTNISFEERTSPSSLAFSKRRWVGSSVFS